MQSVDQRGLSEVKSLSRFRRFLSSLNAEHFTGNVIQSLPYIFTQRHSFLRVVKDCDVTFTSQNAGYVTSPGFNGQRKTVLFQTASCQIPVPSNYTIILKFKVMDICPNFEIGIRGENGSFFTTELHIDCIWNSFWGVSFGDLVFSTNVTIILDEPAKLPLGRFNPLIGFNLSFTLHPSSTVDLNNRSVFSPSGNIYSASQKHLTCSVSDELLDKMENCSLEDDICLTKAENRDKCFFVGGSWTSDSFYTDTSASYSKYNSLCQARGGQLASLSSQADLEALQALLSVLPRARYRPCYSLVQGLTFGGLSVANMYRRVWVGADKSVIYKPPGYFHGNVFRGGLYGLNTNFGQKLCTGADFNVERCELGTGTCALCEIRKLHSSALSGVDFPELLSASIVFANATVALTECPDQHVTHVFLTCDPRAKCGQAEPTPSCISKDDLLQSTIKDDPLQSTKDEALQSTRTFSVPMFLCDDKRTHIHYSLVCDFRLDCPDHSDETFCIFPRCVLEFTCDSGQCVPYDKRGDKQSDCWDGSDESEEEDYSYFWPNFYNYSHKAVIVNIEAPAVINLNKHGSYTMEKIADNASFPETHYRCPADFDYCLPVYTRCNGYYDCLGHEDELDCESFQCPGFYRCLDSDVCVHADHLCDGWPQCPQRDDEWLCGGGDEDHDVDVPPCPDDCLCHGLSFVCPKRFPSQLYPSLRSLDATGSMISLNDVKSNVLLVLLILVRCKLRVLPGVTLWNLQQLDLSYNLLTTLNVTVFLELHNLKTLTLAHNPLRHMITDRSSIHHRKLRHLDLSFTKLTVFNGTFFSSLILKSLNLSHSPLLEISKDGFRHTPSLTVLDLTASPVRRFPNDVLKKLDQLESLASQNYRLCCASLLPLHLDGRFCTAPQDDISSCDDLLRSGVYSGFLWVICLLSVTGNVFCLVFRHCVKRRTSKSTFNLFVTSLSLADLFMGVYIAIIGVADVVFRGSYVLHKDSWTASKTCHAAGFLSLLSSEVSALTIVLITLDRFIVLRFPFSHVRFKKTTASIACLTTWVVGSVLAAVPLLPVTSHWQFYSQTGICIPLPVTKQDFIGKGYSFGILIVLNFVLFLLIAAGQAVIYRSVQQNLMTTDTTRKSQDTTLARRLINIAVTDFLCWFPIGLCGFLALAGLPVPGEVNVALAILVLPLNSALNPFLYTFNVLVEKQRKKFEEKLWEKLKAEEELKGEN